MLRHRLPPRPATRRGDLRAAEGVERAVGPAPVRLPRPVPRVRRPAGRRAGRARPADRQLPPRFRRVARRHPRHAVGRHDDGVHPAGRPGDGHPVGRRRPGPGAVAAGTARRRDELSDGSSTAAGWPASPAAAATCGTITDPTRSRGGVPAPAAPRDRRHGGRHERPRRAGVHRRRRRAPAGGPRVGGRGPRLPRCAARHAKPTTVATWTSPRRTRRCGHWSYRPARTWRSPDRSAPFSDRDFRPCRLVPTGHGASCAVGIPWCRSTRRQR